MIQTATGIEPSKFSKVLYQRINHFFTATNTSKRADSAMVSKIIGGLLWLVLSYTVLYMAAWTYWQFMLLYIFHGLGQVYILLNIAHDANHHSISRKPGINKLLSYTLDLCGINSYMWRILHHQGHHACMNIYGEDEAILAHGLFRLSPDAPWKKIYRFQHLYAFLFYGAVSMDFVFVKDFYFFFLSDYKHVRNRKHAFREYIILFAGKIFYITYMIALPLIFLGFSFWQILVAFLVTHYIMGFITTLVFQTTHVIETTQFPKSADDYENYVFHIFATTADYAVDSPVANFFFGGLHQHIIHHLCPNVCHTHYPVLTKIVKSTAREYGIKYRENRSMWAALVKHFRLLKILGQNQMIA